MGTSRVDVGDVGERGWWSEVFCCVKPRIWLWTYNCKSVCLAMDVQLQVRVSGHERTTASPCVWPWYDVQMQVRVSGHARSTKCKAVCLAMQVSTTNCKSVCVAAYS